MNTFRGLQIYNMKKIGIAKETKIPTDNRVAYTPTQCAEILETYPNVQIVIQPCASRCFKDEEYSANGVILQTDLSDCDFIFGIKEPNPENLIPNKTYLCFSHTKKKQAYNKGLMQAFINKKIELIDYECLTFEEGHRVVGFGYYAGVVGAHNGLLAYANKWKQFDMVKVHECADIIAMEDSYKGLKLPNIKIAVTGSGRVAKGILAVMQMLKIKEVNKQEYKTIHFDEPVFVHLKGADLYAHKQDGSYNRESFHANANNYNCKFINYVAHTDLLINGIYWDGKIARLFELEDTKRLDFKISVIADVTCDLDGSVPTNIHISTIDDPFFGVHKHTHAKVASGLAEMDIIDMMTIDNLPNELPRDASKFFGEHLEKFILAGLLDPSKRIGIIDRATICKDGKLTAAYEYLSDYAY